MVFFVAGIQSKAQMVCLWQNRKLFVVLVDTPTAMHQQFLKLFPVLVAVPKMVFPEPTHLRFAVPVALPKAFPVLQDCQSFEMTLPPEEKTQLISVKDTLNMVVDFLPLLLIRVACNMASLPQETESALLFVLLAVVIRLHYFRPL